KRSTPSAHGVARLLVNTLPQVEVVEFENLGHMGPVTHPDVVNQAIGQFLERTLQSGATPADLESVSPAASWGGKPRDTTGGPPTQPESAPARRPKGRRAGASS